MEFRMVGSSSSYFSSSSPRKVAEKDLLSRLADKNYENSGVDVTLTLAPPTPSVKKCLMCGETQTPLWRTGPLGRKTVCNACGIRYRKEEQRLNTNLTLAPSNPKPQANGRGNRARA